MDRLDCSPKLILVLQIATAMGKATQRRIDLLLKRKRDETSEIEEDCSPPAANNPLPLLELKQQQQQSQGEGVRTDEPVTFQGNEFLQ